MNVPQAIKRLVEEGKYDLSSHARLGMADCGISDDDLVRSVTEGRLTRSRPDERGSGKKLSIVGPSIVGRDIYSAGKVLEDENEEDYYYFITVHWAD